MFEVSGMSLGRIRITFTRRKRMDLDLHDNVDLLKLSGSKYVPYSSNQLVEETSISIAFLTDTAIIVNVFI